MKWWNTSLCKLTCATVNTIELIIGHKILSAKSENKSMVNLWQNLNGGWKFCAMAYNQC